MTDDLATDSTAAATAPMPSVLGARSIGVAELPSTAPT